MFESEMFLPQIEAYGGNAFTSITRDHEIVEMSICASKDQGHSASVLAGKARNTERTI